ncbi:MAG: flavin reductase family protein [Opitutae bacterium]|nr:flavin reductase family protein [Opitutae bacterium]MCD8298535.1 flavin reductase family protein [Opitutae bacterium]
MKDFKQIPVAEFTAHPFSLINRGWMLIAAGNREKFNAMTASWGGLGTLWNKPVAFVFIRPQRYTKEFVDANERFSLSFPPAQFRKAMSYIGTVSGRDENKIEKSGLTSAFDAAGTPYFEEAHTVLLCRKLYAQPMGEEFFLDGGKVVKSCYPLKDFHTLYVGEIEKVLSE